MSDFSISKLEDIAEIGMGQSPPSSTYNQESVGLPFLQGCADFTSYHPITATYCDTPTRIAPKGSILISVRAPVGSLNIADQEYCIGRGLGYIQGRNSSTKFLYYLLTLQRKSLENQAQGSTFEAINSKELKNFTVQIPSHSEQRKIAKILTTVDNLIEKTEALIAKYEAIKQGMMHDLFTRGVDENGRLRPSYQEAPGLYRETEFGKIPKFWKLAKFSDVCEWMSGGTPNKNKPQNWSGNIPWVSPKDMKLMELHDSIDHISDFAAKTESRLVPPETLFIVIRGMILAHAFPVAITTRQMAISPARP